jgi:hypothetical protein
MRKINPIPLQGQNRAGATSGVQANQNKPLQVFDPPRRP